MSQTSVHIMSSLARFASLAQLCEGIAASRLRVGSAWLVLARVALVSSTQVGHDVCGHSVGNFNAKNEFTANLHCPGGPKVLGLLSAGRVDLSLLRVDWNIIGLAQFTTGCIRPV